MIIYIEGQVVCPSCGSPHPLRVADSCGYCEDCPELRGEMLQIPSRAASLQVLRGQAITPLYEHLATFVPLEILELERQGGPTAWHFEEIQRRRQAMRDDPRGDESLLFYIKGYTANSVGFLVECLAIMAFMPGGVRFGPLRFQGGIHAD